MDYEGQVVAMADFKNSSVSVFSLVDGKRLHVLGTEGSEEDQLRTPCDVDIDGEGKIIVADTHNGRICVYSPEGTFLTTFRAASDPSSLTLPWGVAVNSKGEIVTVDYSQNKACVWG